MLRQERGFAAAFLRLLTGLTILPLAGCDHSPLLIGPSAPASHAPISLVLQAEPGSGDGYVLNRSRAIDGQTLHLAPGERRNWTFVTLAETTRYVVTVRYSNSRGGPREFLTLRIDGEPFSAFEVSDTGDETEGWNVFAAHSWSDFIMSAGEHTLAIQSSGGDGCVEIDFVSVNPS